LPLNFIVANYRFLNTVQRILGNEIERSTFLSCIYPN